MIPAMRRALSELVLSDPEAKPSPAASYAPAYPADRLRVTVHGSEPGVREVAEETPVAIVHDGSTHAVMMATPADLEDFAVGFSLTENVIRRLDDVRDLDVVESELGVELRLWLAPERSAAQVQRRRTLAGPTGCGLCGIESLEALKRPFRRPQFEAGRLCPGDILAAMESIGEAQALGRRTRAVHAAGLWRPGEGLVLLREDVGRHNAVDKLVGASLRADIAPAGVLVLTSRVSVELVEKAAVWGVPVIAAVSAPTALAIRTAEANDTTLVAIARPDGFEVFTRPDRLSLS
jgi:FdhD protein